MGIIALLMIAAGCIIMVVLVWLGTLPPTSDGEGARFPIADGDGLRYPAIGGAVLFVGGCILGLVALFT